MSVASDNQESTAHPPILRDVTIEGQECSALYDTGSSICLVSEKFVKLSGAKMSDKNSHISILGVTGNPISIIGETKLKINILGQTVEHKFYVSSKSLAFNCDIILGIDFIIGHQLIYNPSSRSVTFLKPVLSTSDVKHQKHSQRLSPKRRKRVRFLLSPNDDETDSDETVKLFTTYENKALTIDDEISYPLFVKNTVEIPSYSEQFVRMKLPRYLEPNDFPYFVQGHSEQSIRGIQIARVILFLEKPSTLVRVFNASDRPVILRRNLRIAQIHPTKPDDLPQADSADLPKTRQTVMSESFGQTPDLPQRQTSATSVNTADSDPDSIPRRSPLAPQVPIYNSYRASLGCRAAPL